MYDSASEEFFDNLSVIFTRLETLEEGVFLKSNKNSSRSNLESLLDKSDYSGSKCLDNDRDTVRDAPELWTIPNCFMEKKRDWLYSCIWCVVNLISIVISIIYISKAYFTWQSSPVVQTLSNSQVHYDNVSFPAVSICWANTINADYEFEENVEKCLDCKNKTCNLKHGGCTRSEMATLALAYQMCPNYVAKNPVPKQLYEALPKSIDNNEFNIYMEKLFPACKTDVVEMEILSETAKEYTRCDTTFHQYYTSNTKRMCMTYNSLPREDIFRKNVDFPKVLETKANLTWRENPSWSFDNMMKYRGGIDTLPIYGLDAIYISVTRLQRRYANVCSLYGVDLNSIIIHSPNEIPLDYDTEVEYVISENTMLDLYVAPAITLAREDLEQYQPEQRGCLYAHERKLTMFKLYTKKNCEVECVLNAYLNKCGCLPYVYPRPNDSVKVCLSPCKRPKYRCECLPDCNSLAYDVITQDYPMSPGSAAVPRGRVNLMLLGNKYYTKVRYGITSYAEFLAYSLGVLGVFCGFSIKCIWEMLYFGTLRFWTFVKSFLNKSEDSSQNDDTNQTFPSLSSIE